MVRARSILDCADLTWRITPRDHDAYSVDPVPDSAAWSRETLFRELAPGMNVALSSV